MMWAQSTITDRGTLQKGGKRTPHPHPRAESLEGAQILRQPPQVQDLCRPRASFVVSMLELVGRSPGNVGYARCCAPFVPITNTAKSSRHHVDLSAASAEFKSTDFQDCSGGTRSTTNPRAAHLAYSQYSQNNKELLRRSLGNTGI